MNFKSAMHTIEEIISAIAIQADMLTEVQILQQIEDRLRLSLVPFSLSNDCSFAHVSNNPGLYLIDIKFPFSDNEKLEAFITGWGKAKGKVNPPFTARASTSNAQSHATRVSEGEFVPFYLGKSLKVRDRLHQHVLDDATSTTFGLKLMSRPQLLEGCTLRASVVTFNIAPDAYFCVGLLEAALRKKIQPIVGKQ
jgi:hypothetical protein